MSQTNLIANTYNPHNQTEDELIEGFVVRTKEFKALYNDIKSDKMQHPPQHAIIHGRRGSGKTTFLLRLYYEIKRDASVNKWLLPLIFNEEQYSVRTLYKLWESVAVGLENEYEEKFSGLPDVMEAESEKENYEEICFELLKTALQKQKKKLLLLIDNFGVMLQKFDEHEQHRLREILITTTDIKIIGASAVALESTFDYSKPFFEFFKIIELPGLSKDETITLLSALGEHHHKPQIQDIINKKPGKIETLRRLTDGVPRTMILLFEIFIDDDAGDSFKDLEMVLDRVTPLYKHRMDELSAQQQELVDIIALQWDAVAVKEIAQKSRMESKAVSSQLRILEKNHIVTKIMTSTKNHFYQISERFFNIWYLMRYGRKKEKSQVLWLTRFLEEWCDREELAQRAQSHVKALQNSSVYEPCAYYMTEALAKTELPLEIQDALIKETRSFLQKKGSPLSYQLSESNKELLEKAINHYDQKEYNLALKNLNSIHLNHPDIFYLIGLSYYELKDILQAEKYYKMAVEDGNVEAMFNLALLYEIEKKDFNQAEKYYKMAVEKGHTKATNNLALFYKCEKKDFDQAEKYFKMAIGKGDAVAMYNLAFLYETEKKDFYQAEQYYKMAVEKGDANAMVNLALLYETEKKDFDQAEKYYQMACERGHNLAHCNIAYLYYRQRKNKILALEYIAKAFAQDSRPVYGKCYALILLWNDNFEKSFSIVGPLLKDPDIFVHEYPVVQYLLLLIAKRQYNFAFRLFHESPINLRERYRPIYYALMYFMQDSHPDEFKKMGSELEQTVMEVVKEIKKMAETM
jgi:TPR repeat protein